MQLNLQSRGIFYNRTTRRNIRLFSAFYFVFLFRPTFVASLKNLPSFRRLNYPFYERVRVEIFDVVEFFAHAHVRDGNLQFVTERNDKTALCRTVEFG